MGCLPDPTCPIFLFVCIGLSVHQLAGPVGGQGSDEQRITVVMNYGGQLHGRLISEDESVLVMDIDGLPCAIAYDQLEARSAFTTMRHLMLTRRGSADALTAEDHFNLGSLLLGRNRHDRAKREFQLARRKDASWRAKCDAALATFRRDRHGVALTDHVEPSESTPADSRVKPPSFVGSAIDDERREKIIEGYKRVGEQVRRKVGADLVLVETEHFLIWTDWARAEHDQLAMWCESMYAKLSGMFDVPSDRHVFPGKCLVFCLRSQARFLKAAKILDNYNAVNALGYTSTDPNGHTHVVVFRQGGSPVGRDAFASTLVHEGVHAFVHLYRGQGRLPTWVNEGLANVVAEAVLEDRCPNAETAAAASSAFVAGNLPLATIMVDDGMLDPRVYPLAHSLVAFLMDRNPEAFSGLINDIKATMSMEQALERRYGWSIDQFDRAWRTWVVGGMTDSNGQAKRE